MFDPAALQKLRLPILMMIGDHDKLNPPSTIERARKLIPHLEAEIVSQADHMLSMEQPDFVSERILSFLA